jgi:hypothetical protein
MSEAQELRRLRKQMLVLDGARHRQELRASAHEALGRLQRLGGGLATASLARQILSYAPLVSGVLGMVRWGRVLRWGVAGYTAWLLARVVIELRRAPREGGVPARAARREPRPLASTPAAADDGISDLVD